MKPTKIYLGVPAQNAVVHVGIVEFLSKTRGGMFKYNGRLFEIESGFIGHCTPVEAARNLIVQQFLATDADWLLFVDADVYPTETGLQILDAIDKADIVTGRVTIWMPDPDKNGWVIQPTAAVKVDQYMKQVIYDVGKGEIRYDIGGAGTGCLLVNRRVLEDRRLWGEMTYQAGDGTTKQLKEDEPPPVFRTLYKPNGTRLMGEDYDFTSRAKNLGYTLAYVPYAHWHHSKTVSLIDLEKYANKSYENGFHFGRQHAAGEKTA